MADQLDAVRRGRRVDERAFAVRDEVLIQIELQERARRERQRHQLLEGERAQRLQIVLRGRLGIVGARVRSA